MSDEPNSKRRKMNRHTSYHSQNRAKKFLEPGIRGFLATCNFAEKDCVRECYNLLNEYADQLASESERAAAAIESQKVQSKDEAAQGVDDDKNYEKRKEDDDDEEDIATKLQKQINTMNANKQENRYRFQQVETNVSNCIFIKTTLPNEFSNELGVRIARDIAATKKSKTRTLLRIWPVDAVCRANINDIKNAAGQLFDKVFLNAEPTTYSIAFNKRHNTVVDRMSVIDELASLVSFKSSAHKVDLKTPNITIVVEVIKGLCCISLLPDYFKLKKYNVHELAQADKDKEATPDTATKDQPKDECKSDAAETVEATDKPDKQANEPDAGDQQS